ncbi:MAG: acetylornithine/succinylornithine family transaminase [Puniceicoccales bacterium]|jgi:acetylornithine aminotransferase/acetylornithine/N-succinyldiaminopimelate aminotransferase|nr:acetylornithine/succinylornithine family transaminase [Puniceicoccales bacterium]
MNTAELYEKYILSNYGVRTHTLVRGEGVRAWDDTGKCYLDFCTGIAVDALGHSHPQWVRAVQKQAATLVHTSNLFRNELQGRLAQAIVQKAGPGKMFFCNSGTEANEALLKLARLHGRKKASGAEGVCHKVIVAEKAFHGRTFGAMSATPQDKIQNGFRPMLDGFAVGKMNDLSSFEKLIGSDTAAILIEAVQGEGGLSMAKPEFLQGLRALCDKHGILLMFDEIQCGLGRVGKFLAFQLSGVKADAFSLAKGLAGGFPMGGIWVAEQHTDLFTPGSHGATFGGNPLACAAALAMMEVLDGEGLIEKIAKQTPAWHQALNGIVAKHPKVAKEVRGVGYMTGIALHVPTAPVVMALREEGLLTAPAGGDVIRLLPPLIATEADLAESVAIFDKVLARMESN